MINGLKRMCTLNKQVFNKLDTGWLAPNGDWYPCDYMEHLVLADDLWKSMGQAWVPDVEQKLLEMGWVEIQLMRFDRPYYLFHWNYEYGHLTPEQVQVIKPIVENNWNMILKSNRFELKMEFER